MPDPQRVAVTGIGMVTPLGNDPAGVLGRLRAGVSAAGPPAGFDATAFDCAVCARISDFDPRQYVSEPKMVRLMNRDAQLMTAAAQAEIISEKLNLLGPQIISIGGGEPMLHPELSAIVGAQAEWQRVS